MKNTVTSLLERKNRGEKIAMVTAYDYTMARLVSAAGADMILVGDSLGMVMMGMPGVRDHGRYGASHALRLPRIG